MNDFKTILLTTDFSDTSKKAFAPALTLARKFGAKIILAYVEDFSLAPLVEYVAIDIEEIRERQHEQAQKRLREIVEKDFGRGVAVEVETPMGVPHQEIARLAKERKADLIVIATHGRGFISQLILGSTTEKVLRHSPCPVLIVRSSDGT